MSRGANPTLTIIGGVLALAAVTIGIIGMANSSSGAELIPYAVAFLFGMAGILANGINYSHA